MLATSNIPLPSRSLRFITEGRQTIDMPIISPMFATTEPTELPTAMSRFPSAVAIMETRSSGKVVATLTTVAPMTNFGTPETSAIHVAASTKKSPPLIIRASPNKNRIITHQILIPMHRRAKIFYVMRGREYSNPTKKLKRKTRLSLII